MRIIDRYIIHEIVKPLVVICAILLGIFVSYITAEFLADAASGLLPARIILYLILLKVLVSLEFLLPTTLFFSVVIALGRLYTDTEMTALFACGVSLNRVIKVVFSLSLFVAALVAGLSLYIRPWAYDTFYRMRDRAMAEFDLGKMEGGNFYEIPLEGRIFFAEAVDPDRNRATGVFLETARGGRVQVISAKELYQKESGPSDRPVLVFEDGYLYEFPREEAGGHIVRFRESTFALEQKEARPLKYRVRAAPTKQLYLSVDPPDVAEGQWRLTAPLSSVLLALLAIPLSRAAPRQGKYAKVVVAVVSYALYYNLSAMAKAWVETGVVSRVPGIWWVPALLAGLVLALLWRHLLEYLPWKGLLPTPPDRSSSRGGP
jgi:lipopolysaccharide export system permease protein